MHNFIKMTQDICFCQQQHKRINNSYRNREKFLSKDGKKKVRLGLLLFPQPEVHYYTFRVPEVLVEEKVYVRRDKVLFKIILFCLLVIRTSLNTIVECGRVYRHLKNNSYFPNVWCLSLFRAHISNHYQILTCMIHPHSLQLCPTLCDLMDCSMPGSSVHGILQARILEWVAISFSRGSSWPRDQTSISFVSWIGRWIPYHWTSGEALRSSQSNPKMRQKASFQQNYRNEGEPKDMESLEAEGIGEKSVFLWG